MLSKLLKGLALVLVVLLVLSLGLHVLHFLLWVICAGLWVYGIVNICTSRFGLLGSAALIILSLIFSPVAVIIGLVSLFTGRNILA